MADDRADDHTLRGIHHITLVGGHAERTARFYVEMLGLRLVKKTVNFDQPSTYHLYFGDEMGSPGTLVTFFAWPQASPGRVGIGTTHHLALTVGSFDALLKWKTYLQHHRHPVAGPYRHEAYSNIIFNDPDGVQLELATEEPGFTHEEHSHYGTMPEVAQMGVEPEFAEQEWPDPVFQVEPDMKIQGIHHISPMCSDIERTNAFYQDILAMPLLRKTVDDSAPAMPRWYWCAEGESHAVCAGGLVTYFEFPREAVPVHGEIGRGLTHHFAFQVADDESQLYWRQRLEERGIPVTPVLDRKYFRSIYFNDPDGHILEIATMGPGFLVDEPKERLGTELTLPEWLESRRSEIEQGLEPIHLAEKAASGELQAL